MRHGKMRGEVGYFELNAMGTTLGRGCKPVKRCTRPLGRSLGGLLMLQLYLRYAMSESMGGGFIVGNSSRQTLLK